MKFKELSDSDKTIIYKIHLDTTLSWDTRMSLLMSRFSISERTARRWIAKLGFSTHTEELNEIIEIAKTKNVTKSKFYFLSWAQNATPIHTPFFNNIKTYASYLGAELYVVPGRYRNPTSVFTDVKDDWWDSTVEEYLTLNRMRLHNGVTLAADVKVQPTASDPLTGFEGLTGESSTIFGHPRVHLRTLPVLDGHPFKFLFTTGAVTIPNYTDSKAGKKGEFHHTYGFVIVEVKDDDTYFIRQVTASLDGSFYDLMNKVSNEEVTTINNVEAYVMGDLHSSEKDEPLFEATLKYLEVLQPKNVMLHDAFSGKSISHHERKDPIKQYQKLQSGAAYLEKEIEITLKDIETLLPYNPVIVRSNHCLFLDRWIVDQDWKKEIHNSPQYLKCTLALLENRAEDGLFPYIVRERFGDRVKCLKLNDSFKVCGWELSSHGHMGANGSRGSIEQFRKFNTKMITADSHVCFRKDGAVSVGTHSKLRMGFNNGPSSWCNADAIIHENGKAQHLIFFNNEFTTLVNGKTKYDT
jgi:hypothetical protein